MSIMVNQSLALRYLGCFAQPELQMRTDLAHAAALIEQTMQPRHITCVKNLSFQGTSLHLSGTTLMLEGNDIRTLLRQSQQSILLCATLGDSVDRLIRLWQIKDLSFASMLDACASSAIETYCDTIETELITSYRAQQQFLTDRFSPGYGDFPLHTQIKLCNVLDTARRIGVQVSPSSILSPGKSITAVLGICATPQPHRDRCCDCSQLEICPFRKEGTCCANP